jgi:hypothetical protein
MGGRLLCATIVLCLAAPPAAVRAHEVPSDARAQLFVKPEGSRLRLLVRVPMASINDVNWPETGTGMLDLSRADRELRNAVHQSIIDFTEVYENGRRLGEPTIVVARASLPSNPAFDGYETALAHLTGPPLPADTELVIAQSLLDALLEYPIESEASKFAIHPAYNHLGGEVLTVLRFVTPEGIERPLALHNDPGRVELDPSWIHAASLFIAEGFFHILSGTDHLLFLLCLVIPFRRFRSLVPIVTSFTVAHSVTLIASAYDMAPGALWFPPLVETLIASSILYMALENIVAPGLQRRWIVTFAFGLVHGFGFSFALRETLQLAGSHLLTALVSFNVGVELGQLLMLAIFIPALELMFRFVVPERLGTILVSAFVAHTGWHWMSERAGQLARYQFQWPVFDAAFFALLLRWAIVAVVLAAAAWLVFGVLGQRKRVNEPLHRAKSEI